MTVFEPRNPDFARVARDIFEQAPFLRLLGIELESVAPGHCRSVLPIRPELCQQDGYVHAGVQATLADHTAGTAAATLMAAKDRVLTIEFKINLLRAARGDRLSCRAAVIRPGKTVTVAESDVYCVSGGAETLTAKALVTLSLMQT
jgi:uncharacterized protein (TIGR00369 family)